MTWIKCSEQQPPPGEGWYLVWFKGHRVPIVAATGKSHRGTTFWYTAGDPDYWMPLPEPPKEAT